MDEITKKFYRERITESLEHKRAYRRQRNKQVKWILIFLGVAVLFLLLGSTLVDAEEYQHENGISEGIFKADYNRLPNEAEANYQIDVSDTTQEEQQNSTLDNVVEGIQNFNPIGDTVEKQRMDHILLLINSIFAFNMFMVNIMVSLLDFAFNTDIINALLDAVDGMVQSVAGVDNGLVSGGLFGGLMRIGIVLSALLAGIQLFSRGQIASMQTLLKTVVAVTFALFFFSNFGPVTKGLNEITALASNTILTGTASALATDSRDLDAVQDEVAKNLWNEFIGRPYMILQYGADDIEEVGADRVNELLALSGDERVEYVEEKEIGERGNTMMTYENMLERLAFTVIFTLINIGVGTPIFILSFALIVVKLWFLLIACIAPFALLLSIYPNQFPVLRRYLAHLSYPLLSSIVLTGITLFIFVAGFAIYSVEVEEDISRYIAYAVLELALFALVILFRKPIISIMTAGSQGHLERVSQDLRGLKMSMDHTATQIGSLGKTIGGAGLAAMGGGASVAGFVAGKAVSKFMEADEEQIDEVKSDSAHTEPLATMEEDSPADHVNSDSVPHATISDDPKPEEDTAEVAEDLPEEKEENMTEPFATADFDLSIIEKEEQADDRENEATERKG